MARTPNPSAEPHPAPGPRAARLRRHADVRRALHDPRLGPPGQRDADDPAHRAVRAAAAQASTPARLAVWRAASAEWARALVGALPDGVPVDLVAELAEPWSLQLALAVTGAPADHAAPCADLARRLYLAAARATGAAPQADALDAALALARLLTASPARPDGIADVQTFVALTQTLPALLAGAWWVLLRQPDALASLMAEPGTTDAAVDELIRVGGPARAVFREAREPADLGHARVARGQALALRLAAANRDPAVFADPLRLDLSRDASGHLSFGSGAHRCAGAALVRMAVGVATEALLAGCAELALHDASAAAPQWRGGFAMRAPAALWVRRLSRR